ncbi:secreted Ly-6/uPAR domain-containing protein 2-like [Phoca vitulina]|uniref:secreted Ly-6/uPAR domain-containing protein 2-like n=1 Tax=Phoca vitulina TaxID=9720 RepID=UPI0013961582|nr:secreted Ly-6/uPAR domain-containing protein 2-like [Phoca vitulina]
MGPAPSGKPVTLNSKAVPVGMAPTRTGADLCGFLCPGCKPSTSTLQGVSRYHAPFTARALKCHQCKGFGGCLHAARCPWGSNYCVIIGTRDPSSAIDLPLVTKSCYSNCPDILSLGLGPNVSIVCCQYNLCNTD